MSYDLGCFAECLRCELCPKPEDDEIDLDLPDDYDPFGDGSPSDPFDGWEPEEEGSDDPWDGFEVPDLDLPGGGSATPDWDDGPFINFEWPWG